MPVRSSCTVTFSVTSSTVGGNPNTTSGVTTTQRSEERRVGKEGRSRWSPYHQKKKAFNPTSIQSGGRSVATLTLSYSNGSNLTGCPFTDSLSNMSAVGGAVGGTCTGTSPNPKAAGETEV